MTLESIRLTLLCAGSHSPDADRGSYSYAVPSLVIAVVVFISAVTGKWEAKETPSQSAGAVSSPSAGKGPYSPHKVVFDGSPTSPTFGVSFQASEHSLVAVEAERALKRPQPAREPTW